MHIIAASRLINATQYAAALGLAPKEWRAVTTPSRGVLADAFHILPEVDPAVAEAAVQNSVKSSAKLFDHR